ncbi:Vacuolar protein sorting-associated protein 52 [Mycoemilia scoparia]|uniref:Vacuolar protein sorting-associated protein 52 n=1 Tax=Mycoemilia scoparia TaxID=417184 RepID=A0A9W7ZQD3_9FUNG|nr:Vacuolar protein sorting-associated protein 52 [Mycoemilia scoparia]
MEEQGNIDTENYFEAGGASGSLFGGVGVGNDIDDDLSFNDTDDLDRLSISQIDSSIMQILEKGVDIRKYSKEVGRELKEESKKQLRAYEEQEEALTKLHEDIKDCDNVLAQMEDELSKFKINLGGIHNDIQELQSTLLNMSISLNNHIITEKQLSKIIDGFVISPTTVKVICEGEVDSQFLDCIIDLNKKILYTVAHQHQKDKIKSFGEIESELDMLRLKASMRIREFLLGKIKSLRALNTNVLMIQNSVLTKYRLLNHFLIEHHPEAAVEVRDNYIHVMRHYYQEHFSMYYEGLKGLEQPIGDKTDLIGNEEQAKMNIFGQSKPAVKDKRNMYNIGSRINVLRNEDDRALIIPLAEEAQKKIFFEELLRSYLLALVDNASSEYQFITRFFVSPKVRSKPAGIDMAKMIFAHIFDPPITAGKAFIKAYVETSFDALALLLCVLIAKSHKDDLDNQQLQSHHDAGSLPPLLGPFMEDVSKILLPRFREVMKLHTHSIKKLQSKSKNIKLEAHPHTSVRRYSELTVSLLKLSATVDLPEVEYAMNELRTQVHEFLQKAAANNEKYQQSLVSLINNYDLIVNIIQEHEFTDQEADVAFWRQLLADTVYEYAEEQLRTHFKYLKECVVKYEQLSDIHKIDPKHLNQVILQFNKDWQKQISNINTSIIQSFSNFRTGTEILHAVLGQLVIYYTRFHNLYDKYIATRKSSSSKSNNAGDASGNAGGNELTHIPVKVKNVMIEAKKYRSNF